MASISEKLNGILKLEEKLELQKVALLNKALQGTNPNDLMKANEMLTNIEPREQSDRKSYVVDPNDWRNFSGYKEKPIALSYGVIRRISYTVPIVRAVINTRIDQIASFCEPQTDLYSTGFVIRKKKRFYEQPGNSLVPTPAERKAIDDLTDFVMDCGVGHSFEGDDFDAFTRKVFNDALTFDQMNAEIVRDRRGLPYEFYAVDASTMRIADSYDDDFYQDKFNDFGQRTMSLNRKPVKGYYPSYCQIYNSAVVADFYPWEMMWGVRNPSSNVYNHGYGISEIEMLVNTVTSMLWADEYNRKFFSQGSAPKGLLKIKTTAGVNSDKINQFKLAWQSMMSGVTNSHKTPILEADADWIDLQKTNRDMEFSQWYEFLIKVSCAIYRIDPAEVNFPLSGGAEQRALFEGNNEARLKHSKDKGLRPLLKFYQRHINKYLISQRNPDYELIFVGLDSADPKTDIEQDNLQVQNFKTVDEIRFRRKLPPMGPEKGGDIILNPVWLQNKTMGEQLKMQKQQFQHQKDQDNQDMDMNWEKHQNEMENSQEPAPEEENPFDKALQNYWDKLNKQ